MKYGKEFELVVDGESMRGIQAWGNEDELSRVAIDAVNKGWELHLRKPGEMIFRKAYQQPPNEVEAEPVAETETAVRQQAMEQLREVEALAEWEEGMRRSESLPEGRVVCARCSHADRTLQLHGMMRCGSPAGRSSAEGRATFYGPFYVRACNDYAVAPIKQAAVK